MSESTEIVEGSVIPAVVDGGEWSASFGLSWTDLMLYDQAVSHRIIREGGQYLRKQAGAMGVAGGRNEIMRAFLASDAEWLFMIDSDMGFERDTVDRLVSSAKRHGAKVVGGLCFAQKIDPDVAQGPSYAVRFRIIPTIYEFVEVKETGEMGFQHINKYRRDAFQTVAGTGAACLLIHRDAAEAVGPDPFEPMTIPGAGGNGTARTYSEDLSFCIRVQAADIRLGVDTSVKTSHYKGGIYLDEIQFAMQQETLIQAKGHEIARLAEWAARKQMGPFGLAHAGHPGSDRWTGGDRKDEP